MNILLLKQTQDAGRRFDVCIDQKRFVQHRDMFEQTIYWMRTHSPSPYFQKVFYNNSD